VVTPASASTGFWLGTFATAATATATETLGIVTVLTVTGHGSGYGTAPVCVISGGGGAGATCSATISGGQVPTGGLSIITPGTGYTSNPTVTLLSQVVFSVSGTEGTLANKVQLTAQGATTSGDVVTYDGSGNVQDSGTLLSSLAPLASPTFTGTVTVPTLNATSGLQLNSVAIQASAILNAFCLGLTGTGAASTYILSPAATGSQACTITGATESPMPYVCTAKNLYINLGTAGNQSNSGIVKLYRNGNGTSITCTTGTSTTCNDTTHTQTFSASDTWSVRYETGSSGSDTIRDVRAAFQCQ
jgi:hypothetical protein